MNTLQNLPKPLKWAVAAIFAGFCVFIASTTDFSIQKPLTTQGVPSISGSPAGQGEETERPMAGDSFPALSQWQVVGNVLSPRNAAWDTQVGDLTVTGTCTGCGSGGGGGVSDLQIRDLPGSYSDFPATVSFDGNKFTLTASGSSDVAVNLDWGSGGPASLSQSETVTGNWSFVPSAASGSVNIGTATPGDNLVRVNALEAYSNSTSVGGMMLLTNGTTNLGPALVAYTNVGSTANGRLAVFRCDNAAFAQDCVHVAHDGTADGLSVLSADTGTSSNAISISGAGSHTLNSAYTGSNANMGAGNFTSTNTAGSTLQVTGVESALGTVKVTHTANGSDSNSAALSLSLLGTGTQANGIFADTSATYGGKLLNLRTNGTEQLRLSKDGFLGITNALNVGGTASAAYSRFGTGTTDHSLNAANDLLVSDTLELNGQAFLDSSASIAGNFEMISGTRQFFDGTEAYEVYAGNIGGDDRLIWNNRGGSGGRYWFDTGSGNIVFSIATGGTEQAAFGNVGSANRFVSYNSQDFRIDFNGAADANTRFKITPDGDASASGNFEAVGYASSSRLFGSGLTDCDSATTSKLLWTASGSNAGKFSCGTDSGGSATPGGSNTYLQFNDAGAFGGIASLTFNKTLAHFLNDGPASISGPLELGRTAVLSEHPTLEFIDWQTRGGDYTLQRIKAPIGSSKEATLSLLVDVDENNAGINEEFIDFYNERYSDSHQGGIRTIAAGTGMLKEFKIGHWDTITSKNAGDNTIFYPYGGVSILNALNVGTGSTTTASTAYSRFGTTTTGHSLNAANDLLIGDDLEVDGDAWLDGITFFNSASVSAGFEAGTYFKLPVGTAPVVDESGKIAIDTDGFGQLVYYASGSAHTLTDEKKLSVSIGSTSFNTFASRSLEYLFRGKTIKRIQCKVSSGTSVVINLSANGTTDMDQITCTTSNTFDDGSISNPTVAKGSDLVLERRTISGSPDYLQITASYVETRE